MKCSECGSPNCSRDEVDIGVGTMYGPWHCLDCGWAEPGADYGLSEDDPRYFADGVLRGTSCK